MLKHLQKLLTAMQVSHDGTLPSIVKNTQKKWITSPGKERWQIQDTLTPKQRKAVLDYGTKAGFFREIKPAHQRYDYAIVLGAWVPRMEKRMDYLVKIASAGVRFKRVILLSGARPLDPETDGMAQHCKTEGDALEFLWKAQPLSKQVPWKHFQHPLIQTTKGKVRPTTADTFRYWLSKKPKAGSCFVVSNQPYCHYQQLIIENILPPKFTYETIGPAVKPSDENATVLLDTIARCLYEMDQS